MEDRPGCINGRFKAVGDAFPRVIGDGAPVGLARGGGAYAFYGDGGGGLFDDHAVLLNLVVDVDGYELRFVADGHPAGDLSADEFAGVVVVAASSNAGYRPGGEVVDPRHL